MVSLIRPLLALTLLSVMAEGAEYEVVGDPVSRLYYLPGCPGYHAVMKKNKKRLFRNPMDAQTSDYQRAKSCARPEQDTGLTDAMRDLQRQLQKDGTTLQVNPGWQPPPVTPYEHAENLRKENRERYERDRLLYDNIRTYRSYW
ncbi:MAG: hypothetical protein G8345_06860 [Magnetococcales bacterium]|nr:hypothetical protein [Magnetococcales bacterium]NGZ26592.1 hypothetical protein [Magnetococcales bacterium]